MIHARLELHSPAALIGLVHLRGLGLGPSPVALVAELRSLVATRASQDWPPAPIKEAVRDLLRADGYKPSGRNKPASEYLAQAARDQRFPYINNVVDCNNLVSLESGLPVSVLDAQTFAGGHDISLLIRPGQADERYIFNPAGQEIELEGLASVCAIDVETGSRPLGNAVKDSMAGKVTADTCDVIGVIWGSSLALGESAMQALCEHFADLLSLHCGGQADILVVHK